MLNLSLNELKLLAKSRGIKGDKSMSKERLLSALSELVESKNSFDYERLKKITKDFNELRDRFLKPQIKEIRKNLYDIKTQKNLSTHAKKKRKKKKLKNIFLNWKKVFLILRSITFKISLNTNLRDVENLCNEISFNQ